MQKIKKVTFFSEKNLTFKNSIFAARNGSKEGEGKRRHCSDQFGPLPVA